MCKSPGHSAKVQQVDDDDSSSHGSEKTIGVAEGHKHGIYASVRVEGQGISFLVDTGSSVTVLAELYRHFFASACPLKPTSVQLFDCSNSKMGVQGCFVASATFQDRSACALLYVVSEGITVLGLDAIASLQPKIEGTSLQCLALTPSTPVLPSELRLAHEHLFDKKLGLANGFKHEVNVRESVSPVASKLRRLPFTVREQVSAEPQKLEVQDIIELVN